MLVRSYCWWPGINNDLEKFIAACELCQQLQNFSNSGGLSAWPNAPHNFYRVYVDFFFKFKSVFLLLVDQRSKWIDVKLMENGTNASETISKLKDMFAIFGLPCELVSDNGPPFSSNEFQKFCQANGIKLVKTPPYHPQSNGIAERSVQVVKKGLEKALYAQKGNNLSKDIIVTKLQNFLFNHRNTPSTVTGISPAESIFKIKPRTRFDLLKPSCHNKFTNDTKANSKRGVKLFKLGESVFTKNKLTKLWQKGKVIKVLSFCTYLVSVGNDIKFVHADNLCSAGNDELSLSTGTCASDASGARVETYSSEELGEPHELSASKSANIDVSGQSSEVIKPAVQSDVIIGLTPQTPNTERRETMSDRSFTTPNTSTPVQDKV